ncbi:hypothetical protein B2J88_35800 [Rhodococcus sp. SRB_17]|nr:hypothetical protein [Rhodococcus sp. SRB_17]
MRVKKTNPGWKFILLENIDSIEESDVSRMFEVEIADIAAARDSGEILGFQKGGGVFVYPAFQFHRRAEVLRPEVKKANTRMDAARNPWAVLAWWAASNEYLEGEVSPLEMLESEGFSEEEIERLISVQFGGY